MPAWTTLAAAAYRLQKWHTVTCDGQKYSVQQHPLDSNCFLMSLPRRKETGGRLNPVAIGDVLSCALVRGHVSRFAIVHVQQLPSWKGNVRRVLVEVQS